MITIDFETRSYVDISKCGAWNYSKDDSTEVLCLAYKIDNNSTKMWVPPKHAVKMVFNIRANHKGLMGHFNPIIGTMPKYSQKKLDEWHKRTYSQDNGIMSVKRIAKDKRAARKGFTFDGHLVLPIWAYYPIGENMHGPKDLLTALRDESQLLEAHNAFFEKCIYNHKLRVQYPKFPSIRPKRWRCSLSKCSAHSLPRALKNAGEAMDCHVQKDEQGRIVMLQMAKPNVNGVFYDDQGRWCQLLNYCLDDVSSEHALSALVPDLSDEELRVWFMDQEINWNGIPVDVDLCSAAIKIVTEYTKVLEQEMYTLTGGELSNTRQTQKLINWLYAQGVDVPNVQKQTVGDLLENGNLPYKAKRVLEIRQALGQTSVNKFSSILNLVDPSDHRIRDNLVYHGASTGRFSGKGAQIQNLPRPVLGPPKDVEEDTPEYDQWWTDLYDNILTGDWRVLQSAYGSVFDALTSGIRGFVKAPKGHKLVVCDYSNIEGRVLAWLADESWKIQAFEDYDNGVGDDLYILAYARSFNVPVSQVTKDDRQIGKVQELALGYQGGVGAFHNMAQAYGVFVTDKVAQDLVNKWRASNPCIVNLWRELEDAAKKSVSFKQKVRCVNGKINFYTKGRFLYCELPSGRVLAYKDPKIEKVETWWGQEKLSLTYEGVNSVTRKTERVGMYGGKWAENITQAIARDIMIHGMFMALQAGYTIDFTVHDELVTEVKNTQVMLDDKRLGELMCDKKEWMLGLPLAAEGYVSERYKK